MKLLNVDQAYMVCAYMRVVYMRIYVIHVYMPTVYFLCVYTPKCIYFTCLPYLITFRYGYFVYDYRRSSQLMTSQWLSGHTPRDSVTGCNKFCS